MKLSSEELRAEALSLLDERRIPHVLGCESEALRLAERWEADREAASVAALLHDCTKKLSFEEQLKMCSCYGIVLDSGQREAPKLLHALTGAALARERFGVSEEIEFAIRFHTTGKPEMSLLEKIIYLADYIEPTRAFEGLEALRSLAYEDIDGAMALALEMSLEEIENNGQVPYKDTVEARNYYRGVICSHRNR